MDLLRFATSGSVDDGKSTLIGRLLYDSKSIFEDQLEAITLSTQRKGREGVDLSLLTDGLAAEREQGITIDVAYRYFSTPKRKFIIADTPGHEQYTRNMVTGASTAQLVLILVDARKGVLEQSRRHAILAHLMRIPHVVVCINKMDLVEYKQERFAEIVADFEKFAESLHFHDLRFIPISALHGDNIVKHGHHMSWYKGPTLFQFLEKVEVFDDHNDRDVRFPVQYVNRPNADFRGYCGVVASGILRVGQEVLVLPARRTTRIKAIHTHDGELKEAYYPMAVTLMLEDEIDISRGDMIVTNESQPHVTHEVTAKLCWMAETPMTMNKKYLFKGNCRTSRIMMKEIKHRIDINTLQNVAASELKLNEIAEVSFKSQQPLMVDAYSKNPATGAFILIDEDTNNTVAAGMVSS